MAKINVLVVDDSALMRKIIGDVVSSDKDLFLIGTAENGLDAIHKTQALRPSVILLDLQMPILDGFEALKQIMARWPTPIIILSAFTKKDATLALDCLNLGAVDFISKPGGTISKNLDDIGNELLRKIHIAAKVNVNAIPYACASKIQFHKEKGVVADKMIGIVSSTGGPGTLAQLLPILPQRFNSAIVVVQHIPSTFLSALAKRLDGICALDVKEAEEGEKLLTNRIYFAPTGTHLVITNERRIHLNEDPPIMGLRPCGDLMLQSAANVFGKNMLAVVLTGMGNDGTLGVKQVLSKKGRAIVQDKNSSIVFGMPKSVIDAKLVGTGNVLSIDKIAERMITFAGET